MKKQKIKTKLTFSKLTVDNLRNVTGGSMPATLDVATYQCPTVGPACGGSDPVPNC